jgi:hypothetical protein
MVKKTKTGVKSSKHNSSATEDPALAYLPEFDAQSMLFGSMLGIGWRLALAVLIPVFIGIWADSKLDTKPSITLFAFFVAIAASGVVIYKMYKQLDEQTSKIKFTKSKKSIKGYDDDGTE